MLQTHTSESACFQATQAMAFSGYSEQRRQVAQDYDDLKLTWSAVEVEGASLTNAASEAGIAHAIDALAMARDNSREEVIVTNIASGVAVGTAEVSELHQKCDRIMAKAAARLGQEAPEMRLSLRGGEYDLRCYVGRTRPTDFSFDSDY